MVEGFWKSFLKVVIVELARTLCIVIFLTGAAVIVIKALGC